MFGIRSRRNKGRQTNISTAILKNMHWDGNPGAFFHVFFVSLSELPPCPVSVRIYTSPYGGRVHRNQRYG
jgi:hypothetical protein